MSNLPIPGDFHQLPLYDTSPFDSIRHVDADGEYWLARELMTALEYSTWQRFKPVIARAKTSCKTFGEDSQNHFNRQVSHLTTKQGAEREIPDVRLSRYACYLIAQNGDVSKPVVAAAQAYFIIQTIRQETQDEKHLKDVTGYQLKGRSHDWSEARVSSKESQKRLNAALTETHEEHKPNYGAIAAEQNQGLFEMTKREIVDYLGLLPGQEPRYRDFLGKYAQMAVNASNSVIVDRMKVLGRDLTHDEQRAIVQHVTRIIAPTMRELAEYAHIDYLSGSPLDDEGRALIQRNIRLLRG